MLFNRREILGSLAYLFTLAPSFGFAKQRIKTPKEFIESIKELPYTHPFNEFYVIELRENGPDYVEFPIDILNPSVKRMETKTSYEYVYGHRMLVTLPTQDYIQIKINLSGDIEKDAKSFILGCLPDKLSAKIGLEKYCKMRRERSPTSLFKPKMRHLKDIGKSGLFSCKNDTFFLVIKGDKYGFACLNKDSIIHFKDIES